MLPLLRVAGDGADHALRDAVSTLADELALSAAERAELLPSGKQSRFANRVGWAQTYMKKAGLLEASRKGSFRITDRGRQVLAQPSLKLDAKYLRKYPEFRELQKASLPDVDAVVAPETPRTPEELIEEGFHAQQLKLAQDLLERLMQSSPAFFEQTVVDLLLAMGYGGSRSDAGRIVGKPGDEGIDGTIKEDRLGLDYIYIQAKRWEGTVGRPTVQAFVGSLEGARASKGVLITTSSFSPDAKAYMDKLQKRIILIDGQLLVQLMIEHNVGVSAVNTYTIKRIDSDYFSGD
jgi:restriction system protein